jgi:hypothetical protein
MKRLQALLEASSTPAGSSKVYFSERSVVADRHIFAKLLHQENKMSEM